jgi:hypothetical protein
MTPMSTGPYSGIMIYQRRESTNTVKVAGNGSMDVSGTFYAAAGSLDISGSAGNNKIGSQYISWNLKLSGNGNVTIDWNAGSSHTRNMGLVE